MPIEFRCIQCNKLLRCGDEGAGKQARCPQCGTVMPIPAASPGPADASATRPAEGSPFASSGRGVRSGSPFDAQFPPGQTPTKLPADPVVLDFGDVFRRTWEVFKTHWAMGVVATLISEALIWTSLAATAGVIVVVAVATESPEIAIPLGAVGVIAWIAFATWIHIGRLLFFLELARGREAPLTELFSGGPHFLPMLGVMIVVGLIVLGGYCLLIVPGVIFALMYSQSYYLVLDRGLGLGESLSTSDRLTFGNKATIFLVYLVTGIAVIYLVLTGQPTAGPRQGWQPRGSRG